MKTFFVLLFSLSFTAHGIVESEQHDKNAMFREHESFAVYDEDEIEDFGFPSWTSASSANVLVNVDSFAAVGDGTSDDTQAFLSAWNQACSTPKSVLLVPPGRHYLINATRFQGPCAAGLIVQIDGTIIAPREPRDWVPRFLRTWLDFYNLTSVRFQGRGVIDGSGSKWWAASCKKNKANSCKGAPTALTIDSSSSIKIKGLTIQNSQQMHFVISHSDAVRVSNIVIASPGDSPNTDGIHITGSTNVALLNCKSIGSLGKDNSSCIVTKVVLNGAFIRNATNGLRIKTWQGGSGYVKAVRFQNVIMEDVASPIVIDQFYCDSPKPCVNQTTAVQISQVMYRNITGTTTSKEAIKFACSDTVPCSNIVLTNIDLHNKDGTAETYCNSATGIGFGIINPSADCLTSNEKGYSCLNERKRNDIRKSTEDHLVHTEL